MGFFKKINRMTAYHIFKKVAENNFLYNECLSYFKINCRKKKILENKIGKKV